MRALVVWAEATSTNLGVQALGQGTAALADRVWPGVDVRFQSYGAGDTELRIADTKGLLRARVQRQSELKDWVSGFDVVIDTRAGDSFADIYGVDRMFAMSAFGEFVRSMKVPYVLGPQTIGPFTTRRGSLIGRRSLRAATTVMARDSESFAHASRLGRVPDVLTTDVVFAVPVPTPERTRDVILNVSGLLWDDNPHVDATAYRATVTALGRSLLASGRRVSLLAHVLASDLQDNDVPAIQALAATLDADLELIVPTSLADVREYLATAQVVIGSRMHACLNAISVGTPAVPLAYSRKFKPLLDGIGWTHTVDLRTAVQPDRDVLDILDLPDLPARVAKSRDRAAELLAAAETGLRSTL